MSIEEKMLILPALFMIKRRGKAKTTDLITDLTIAFNPSGEDAKILAGRNDTKFSQKVRNLKSHREGNRMDEYTDFDANGFYSLTEKGLALLESRIDELNYFFSHKFDYEDTKDFLTQIAEPTKKVLLYDENYAIFEGEVESKVSKQRERSKILRDAAIKYYTVKGRIECCVCGFAYTDKYGELGEGFIEIHHEKPICQYGEDGTEIFIKDAVKNVKPLCANCHRMIHRNASKPLTIEELKKVIEHSS